MQCTPASAAAAADVAAPAPASALVAAAAQSVASAYRRCVQHKYRKFDGDLHRLPALMPAVFGELYRQGMGVDLDFDTVDGVLYNTLEISLGGAAAMLVQAKVGAEQTLTVESSCGSECIRIPIPCV
jgi:hypothetical protein